MSTTPSDNAWAPPSPLEESVLAFVFGDEDEDPGLIVDEAATQDGFVPWLDRLAADYTLVRGGDPALSPALGRLAALRAEVLLRRAHPIVWEGRPANVLAFDPALRRAPEGAEVRDVRDVRTLSASDLQRKRLVGRFVIGGVIAATLAAAALLLVGVQQSDPEIDARMAQVLVDDALGTRGFGFAGAAAPTVEQRGFLLGAVIDLSRPRKRTGQSAPTELELARTLADRALEGLPGSPADDLEARRVRALGGCGAVFADTAERNTCERGLASYLARRDAALSASGR